MIGKRETDGERRPSFAFPITPCSRRTRYAKTTGDESGVGWGGGGGGGGGGGEADIIANAADGFSSFATTVSGE